MSHPKNFKNVCSGSSRKASEEQCPHGTPPSQQIFHQQIVAPNRSLTTLGSWQRRRQTRSSQCPSRSRVERTCTACLSVPFSSVLLRIPGPTCRAANRGTVPSAERGHAGGERTCVCCTSAMLREPTTQESSADMSPSQVQTFRRWSARTPRGLRRYFQVQGRRVTRSHEGHVAPEVRSKLRREGISGSN